MEKNHFEQVLGAVAVTELTEGKMVCLTSHSLSRNYGSQTDLPGAKIPATADEAATAKFVVAFEADNRSLPIYQPTPSYSFALRYGYDQATNVPFSTTVHLTHPDNTETPTIPSGSNCLLYGEGIYTVPSGTFIYDAGLTPGAQLEVEYSGDDAGKLKVKSAGTAVAEVIRFDSTEYKLTFRIF